MRVGIQGIEGIQGIQGGTAGKTAKSETPAPCVDKLSAQGWDT